MQVTLQCNEALAKQRFSSSRKELQRLKELMANLQQQHQELQTHFNVVQDAADRSDIALNEMQHDLGENICARKDLMVIFHSLAYLDSWLI